MVKRSIILFIAIFSALVSQSLFSQEAKIVDHTCIDISQIPETFILRAKDSLHIAYGHTSHGSQLITGMNGLDAFMGGNGLYVWHDGPLQGFLDIDDNFVSGDLGNPDRVTWAARTRTYLDDPDNSDVNVVIWSWCGQAGTATEEDINTYLNLMSQLENDYPKVQFVYMTGHLDGSGLSGNLHIRNQQIRDYCTANGKVLYDFEDIESYNPDGTYFGDKIPNDNCDYDTDANGSRDGNWAVEWQDSHTEGVDWYNCAPAHTQPLNGNLKAYAAWWLWARLAGWEGEAVGIKNRTLKTEQFKLYENYPNPFNPETIIGYKVDAIHKSSVHVELSVYNLLGQKVSTLVSAEQKAGTYRVKFNGNGLAGGVYFYRLHIGAASDKTGSFDKVRKMILLR